MPWTTQDRFDIEARAQGNPTKADYRLMMQALLVDRFKLKVHYETRVVPFYVLVLAKPGKFGPQLRLHRADDPVCAKPTISQNPNEVDAEGYPEVCGGPYGVMPSKTGRMKSGGRDVSMARLTAILTGVGVVDRPMLDNTGIQRTVDYSMDWRKVADQVAPGTPLELDEDAPTFADALKEQLRINMLPQKGPSELFLVDHIERPSENLKRSDDPLAFPNPRPLDLAIVRLKARTSRTGSGHSASRQCRSLKTRLRRILSGKPVRTSGIRRPPTSAI